MNWNGYLLALGTLCLATLRPSAARAQLTLRDALRQADQAAYGNRIAAGNSAAQAAQKTAALQGLLPTARVEAGYLRTTDPIGVFGATLRQRTVSQSNFDPQRLNYPGAIGNYQGGIVVEQPLFNADAWAGRRAASDAAQASRNAESWTRLSTRVDVVRAYYGAVLAAERVKTLNAAARAARAHVTEAEALVRQGMVTKSDALLASVRAGDIESELAEAEGAAETARGQLAVLLGRGDAELPVGVTVPTELPPSDRVRALVAGDTAAIVPGQRADVLAARQGADAAQSDALRARAAYLPHLNSFARYDWNSPNRSFSGDKNWTVGVMASWTVLTSASELADIQATAGRASSARAQDEAARANALLDVAQTRTALAVALKRLDIAERAAAQSTEAHRIVGRKYEGGLANVTELLDAQAVETQSALAVSQARWGAIVAAADRRRALGQDPATLDALDDRTTIPRQELIQP